MLDIFVCVPLFQFLFEKERLSRSQEFARRDASEAYIVQMLYGLQIEGARFIHKCA